MHTITSYDKFYYKFGLNKLIDFTTPKVLNRNSIVLPYYTMLHNMNIDEKVIPSKEQLCIKFVKETFVYNPLHYNKPIHEAREIKINENSFVSELKTRYKDIDILTKAKFNLFIKSKTNRLKKTIPILNYGYLNISYKYKENIYKYLYKFENSLVTILNDTKDIDNILINKNISMNHFFIFKVSDILPDYLVIRKYAHLDKPNTEFLKNFFNSNKLNIYQIFRLIYDDTREKSLFYNIAKDASLAKRITFCFTIEDKVMFINLYKLMSFTTLYNEENKVNSRLPEHFYALLKLFIKIPSFTTDEIDNGSYYNKIQTIVKKSIDDKTNIEKEDNVDNNDKDIEEVDKITDIIVKTETVEKPPIIEKNKYIDIKSIEDIKQHNTTLDKDIIEDINELYESKKLDAKTYKKITTQINEVLNSKSPYKDNKKIKDLIKITKEELELTDEDIDRPKPIVLYNKKDGKDPISTIDKKYIKNIYKKDMISTILSISKAGLIVKNIEVTESDSILGEVEEYKVEVSDLGKRSYTIKMLIPKVSEEGSFKISGNRYLLKKQRSDMIIKKIGYNRVSLNTAYGKLFVDKAPLKKYDRGFNIKKELLKLEQKNVIKNVISGTLDLVDIKVPLLYSEISRYIKSFTLDKYIFNFNYFTRNEIIDKKYDLNKIENTKYILVGKSKSGEPLVMDENGIIYKYVNNKYEKIDYLLDMVGIDKHTLIKEYSFIKIFKDYIPVAVIMSYYMGLENLLKKMDVEYKIYDTPRKIIKDKDVIVIRFLFNTLVIYPKKDIDYMILSGFDYYKKEFKDMDIDILNEKDSFKDLFRKVGLKLSTITEIEVLDKLFIDPVSKTILEEINEPTTFVGLLIRASELLLTDYYLHPNSLKGFIIKGYERIPQYFYKALVNSIKTKKSEEFFGRSRLAVDPYSVWRTMNEDNASILMDDINPIAYLKFKEDTTYLGSGGRSKESLARRTRELHVDDIGVISESSKDSSDVGITAYMSANPVIGSLRGLKKDTKELTPSNVLSTSMMLSPFSTKDDPKRAVFINTQNSHVLPINNGKAFPVRTGYDAFLPYKLNKKFIGYSKDNGKVIKVTPHMITVQYDNGEKEVFKFKDWTSKEESNTTYIHRMVSNVVEKQKVKEGDIIYYDRNFFEPDLFDKTKVFYRANNIVRVGWEEVPETYEDALLITDKVSKELYIDYIKIRGITLDKDDEIINLLNIGDKVEPNTPLFTINTNITDDTELKKETLDLLQSFIKASPKAKYKGKIIKIQAFYNFDKTEASKSIKKLIEITDKHMIDDDTGKHYDGKVNSSFSIDGKPLEKDKIYIKFSIELNSEMGTGDKCIIGAQLKSTVTNVISYPIVTENGSPIDALFSYKGNLARIVRSLDLMGTTATVLDVLGKKVVDIYFNE